jgi:hypothetical protein
MSDSTANSTEAVLPADAVGSGAEPASRRNVIGYVREGLQIARWDVEAVERVARDPRALVYGACFMVLATLLTGVPLLLGTEADGPRWPFAAIGLLIAAAGQLAISALATAVVHGGAKLLFGATGRYVNLLRVLWVGSVVLWLGVLPVIGGLVGGVIYLLVTLVAVSEVEGVERLQALVLVVGLRGMVLLAGLLLA